MIGILQGRLTPPWNGKLQCFPRGAWDREFELAQRCGFSALELFVETEFNPENPVWSEAGRARIRSLASEHRLATPTLCADSFMTTTFEREPAEAAALLERMIGFGFRRIVLPFFEKAEIRDPERVVRALGGVDRKGVDLAVETTLTADRLVPLLETLPATVCYDLGNTTALGHDVPGDIRKLGRLITHVHIKDKRRSDGKNVLLGTGDTDFPGAFSALRDIGYRGDFTLETDRGPDPVATAKRHLAFVEDLLR